MKKLLMLCALVAVCACRTMEPWQEAEYQIIHDAGLPQFEPNSPLTAGLLNILPGIGDAYNEVWGAFVANLLLWPFSVIWGIPEAAETAKNINKQETWAYYYHGPGKHELDAKLKATGNEP